LNLLFPFASLGVINGLLVSFYLLFRRNRSIADCYFAGLILAFCLRIGKSVLLYYVDPSNLIIRQVGLSACIFIGPFSFLYTRSVAEDRTSAKSSDLWLLLTLLIVIVSVGLVFPYPVYPAYWNPKIVQGIYAIWAVFLILGLRKVYSLLGRQVLTPWKLSGDTFYLATIAYSVL